MKRVVIIEDENIAAQNLERMLLSADADIHVIKQLQSIEDSVEFFSQNPEVDLVFMDIHLADGSAFSIFDQVNISCPIIFTTAYDQYALDAFKVNSIDYLLKPISPEDLHHALDKLEHLIPSTTPNSDNLQPLISLLQQQCRHYKRHFLVPMGEKLVPFAVDNIAFIFLEGKIAYIYDYEGHRVALDKPLDTIMEELDPHLFYRANRQYVVSHNAIREINIWPIAKLRLQLSVPTPDYIIISRAKVQEFKSWYTA